VQTIVSGAGSSVKSKLHFDECDLRKCEKDTELLEYVNLAD